MQPNLISPGYTPTPLGGPSPSYPGFASLGDCRCCGSAGPSSGMEVMQSLMGQQMMMNQMMLSMVMLLMGLMLGQSSATAAQTSPASSPLGGNSSVGGASEGGTSGPSADPTAETGASSSAPPLSGNDAKTAQQINDFFKSKHSPAANQDVGSLIVKVAHEYEIDPRILVAIAGQETQWGKTGIGVRGMLGVGAYDSNPRNAVNNPHFSGVENQLRVGAKTFANLRKKGGSGPNDPIDKQTEAVNRAGWATDKRWHVGVSSIYRQVAQVVH